jgi:uncharacterized protein (DUF2062 family)
MIAFLQRRILLPIRALLIEGVTPQKIALSLTFGIVLGIFPVIGTTTLLCLAAVFLFRLNLPAVQLVNYFVYPVQIALILPFIRAGEFLLRTTRTSLSLTQMMATYNANHLASLHLLWRLALHGIFAWAIAAPFLFAALYFPLLHSLTWLAAQISRRRQPLQANCTR